MNRRQFLGGALLAGSVSPSTWLIPEALAQTPVEHSPAVDIFPKPTEVAGEGVPVDFRYSPALRQTTFCFPDDPHKSLIHQDGSLVYGYQGGTDNFALRVSFALYGMREARVAAQTLDAPGVPIVRTVLEREDATMTLTTFATNSTVEGRVDNVLIEVRPRHGGAVAIGPLIGIDSMRKYGMTMESGAVVVADRATGQTLLVAKVFDQPDEATMDGTLFDVATPSKHQVTFHPGIASEEQPYRVFVRLPQGGQAAAQLQAGLDDPAEKMAEARRFWAGWQPFQASVEWQVGGRQGEFLTACARNILQAREVRDGKLTFQVGPTCYRGLWVVDGNFLLEAARYLGYDKEAEEGLKTTWSKQQGSGQVVASGGLEHYKDTAIAMFTVVRQCELSQDWSLMHELEPNIVAALGFIDGLRARARAEGSALGRYGLLPKGFADGGLHGSRNEFTNTLWTLAGLKAIGTAGEREKMPRIARASAMYSELRAAFNRAAREQMRLYDGRFEYLPMLLREDPGWQRPNPWDRPRPQSAQWALSHTIFPGRVFEPGDAVVRGHVELMQAVRQEAIPAETGWSHHEAVWTYNAAFVAEVYLWLGMKQEAHDTFTGFLNHASPQYCWREEQPLQHALVGSYVGDMPHNWASAECIRYLRHMLALEDGPRLRLLAGITEGELAAGSPYRLTGTLTRFGRVDLALEPLDRRRGWRLNYRREGGPEPAAVTVPVALGSRFRLVEAPGVQVRRSGDSAAVDPAAREWALEWRV